MTSKPDSYRKTNILLFIVYLVLTCSTLIRLNTLLENPPATHSAEVEKKTPESSWPVVDTTKPIKPVCRFFLQGGGFVFAPCDWDMKSENEL